MNRNTGRDPDVCSVRGSAGRWSRGKMGRKLRFTRTLGVLSCCVPRGPRDAPLYGTAAREGEPSRVAALGQPHFPQTEVGREDLAKPWSDRSHSRLPTSSPNAVIAGQMARWRHCVDTRWPRRTPGSAHSQRLRKKDRWGSGPPRSHAAHALPQFYGLSLRNIAAQPATPTDLRESLGTGTELRSQRWRRV